MDPTSMKTPEAKGRVAGRIGLAFGLVLCAALAPHAVLAANPSGPAIHETLSRDPAYKAYAEKRKVILAGRGDPIAKARALKDLDAASRAVLEKALRVAGLSNLIGSVAHVLGDEGGGGGFTVSGDDRIYAAPFSSAVANNGTAMKESGFVASSIDVDDRLMPRLTYRSYVGVDVLVPNGAQTMQVSTDLAISSALVYTSTGYSAWCATGYFVKLDGSSSAEKGHRMMEQDAGFGAGTTETPYPNTGAKSLSLPAVPVQPGEHYNLSAGVYTSADGDLSSVSFATAGGMIKRFAVRFTFAPPTPTPPPSIKDAALLQKAIAPDLVLTATPAGNGWPVELVVKNAGLGRSQSTLVRAKVQLLQADLDVVVQNCQPRFVDFDEAVPALEPGQSSTIPLLTTLKPGALAIWNSLNKPPRRVATKPPLPNPVHQVVTCRYTLTAELGKNQNKNDANPGNNSLTRSILEDVPLK